MFFIFYKVNTFYKNKLNRNFYGTRTSFNKEGK